jgi:signal transduction histidine kinase
VRHLRASSSGDPAVWASIALWPIGVAVGLYSERVRYGWLAESYWIPDLVVGLVFIGCGAQSLVRRRDVAMLLAAVGFCWFLANFWPDALFIYRGVLVHAIVCYPGWRPRSRLDLGVVVAGYCFSVGSWWGNDALASAAAALLVLVVARSAFGSLGHVRRARVVALVAASMFAGGVIVASGLRAIAADSASAHAASWSFEAALCGVALVLVAGLPRRQGSLVDLVVELGATTSGTLRDALASTLGDPTLRVGYWDPRSGYVDAEGVTVPVPAPGGSLTATLVKRGGERFAVLVHDAAVLDDPVLVDAVGTATRLTGAHAELQATVRRQLAELSESRRRLVTAADAERRRLNERLAAGAERHLQATHRLVRPMAAVAGASASLSKVMTLLDETVVDLHELADGLYPRELEHGLGAALNALGTRSPIEVDVSVSGDEPSVEAAVAVYFVCAEALANVVKHAAAKELSIGVRVGGGVVTVHVVDDGVGGADPRRGSGLRGLTDRVEALGGTFQVDSPPGSGTRLVATIPNVRKATEGLVASRSSVSPTSRKCHDASVDGDRHDRSHPITQHQGMGVPR